jgi:hypothetical protein
MHLAEFLGPYLLHLGRGRRFAMVREASDHVESILGSYDSMLDEQ